MNAILHIGAAPAWATPLGRPWPLLPVANRWWVEYWVEWLVAQEIRELHLVLADGAFEIEQALGDGDRWGLSIQYHFLREGLPPLSFLGRDPARWTQGVLWIGAPAFPRRRDDRPPVLLPASSRAHRQADRLAVLYARDEATLRTVLDGTLPDVPDFEPDCLTPEPIPSLADYFALNLAMVRGECDRYLTSGYRRQDRAYLGYNVVYPASARLTAPLMVGNDVRLRDLCTIGPDAILGDRVIVDRQAIVSEAMVLDGTYVGAGVELIGKIAVGRRLIDPSDGMTLDLDDLQLLAPLRRSGAHGEKVRRLGHCLAALVAWVACAPLVLPLLALDFLAGGRLARRRILGVRGPVDVAWWRPGRLAPHLLFRLSAQEWPSLLAVVRGNLWLSGQLPVAPDEEGEAKTWPTYRPGLFTYADVRPGRDDPVLRRIEAAYYAHHRGWLEDFRIWRRGWWGRLAGHTLVNRNADEGTQG